MKPKIEYFGDLTPEALKKLQAKGEVERVEMPREDATKVDVVHIVHIGKATEEQLAEFKKTYGDGFFEVNLFPENNVVSHCYLREPNRTHLARVWPAVADGNKIEVGEMLIDDTWLHGDERCKSLDDKYTSFRVGLALNVYDNVKILEGVIKKP